MTADGARRALARFPALPLFVQVLSLVLLSLVAAVAINLWIIFQLPPPAPEIYRQSEIAQALQGRPLATHEGGGPPLVIGQAGSPPETPSDRPPRSIRDMIQGLSGDLAVPPQNIVVAAMPPHWVVDRRALRRAREHIQRTAGSRDEHILMAPFKVAVRQPDGRWLVAQPKASWYPNPWQQRILLWFALSAIALVPVAYLFARRLSAPISAFAAAAERLGRDPGAAPLQLSGPAEINVAVSAFNNMQDRLRRYVEDRTAMIGAVAHDLRTPLTRLRFRVESAPEPLRAKMTADIEQMEAMISVTLAFVRDATHPAQRKRLELVSLVESIADEMAETGLNAAVEPSEPLVIEGDPVGLRRLLTNLFDNAVKFGGCARARVYAENECALIEIDDDGPGLPEGELERVFEPFHRGEPSRSRETGGAGLGLAVVRSVARAHGGDVDLENRAEGGLRARVRLPL